jgi:hypothetical protein
VAPAAAPASSGLDREASAATPRFEEEAQGGARLRQLPKPTAASRAGDMKPAVGDDALDGLHKDAPATGEAHAAKARKKGGAGLGALAEPTPALKAEAPADKARRDQPMDGRFAPPPPPREEGTTVKRKAPVSESVEKEADEGRASSTTARRAAPAARAPSQPLDDLAGAAAKPAASAGPGGPVAGGGVPRGKADGFGSGAAQAAPAPAAPAPARNEAAKRAVAPPAAEPAPAMTPPPAPKPRAKKSAEYSPEAGYAAADEDAQAKEEKKQANVRSNANETLLQRADRLFADGRWSEAAAIYRDLLRRDPHNDDAERWRRRLAAAETAEGNERNANLAEKRAAESARTRKPAAPAKASKAAGKAAASDAAQ